MEDNNTKEINLLQLITLFLKWLKDVGKSILNFFGYFAKLGYRHKIMIFIVIMICFAIGQYFARSSARVYKAEALAMLYGTDAQTAREICKQLENSVSTNKLISYATKLSLPDSVAKNIVSISSYYVTKYKKDSVGYKINLNDNQSLTDTMNVRMRDRIYLQLKTRNIGQVPKVQTAILNYFNTNPVMRRQFDVKRNELIGKVNICNIEIKRIDSLAKVTYFKDTEKQLRFNKDKLLLGDQSKQLFYGDLLNLQTLKGIAELQLANYSQPMSLPSSLVVNPIPVTGRMKYAIQSIIIGFLLSLVLAFMMENMKNIVRYLNEETKK